MDDSAPSRRFEMIVGLHDLSEIADAKADELRSWLAFSRARDVLDRVLDSTRRTGVSLRITSDDAFRSDYELLLPWLVDRGLVATFFVPTRFLDGPGRLTTGQLREIAGLGMGIGVHGAGHIDWTGVPEHVFLADVREGRDRLQDLIGGPVDCVAPPFGQYNGRILSRLCRLGFREVHTCRPGLGVVREPLKPRNMLNGARIADVLAVSERTGSLVDVLRCRFRRLFTCLREFSGAR